MDNRVLQFRVAMTPTPQLWVHPDHPQPFPLGDRNKIKREVRQFLTSFRDDDHPTGGNLQDIVEAARRVQTVVFSDPEAVHRVTQLLAGPNKVVKVLTEDEDALQIPWELFAANSVSQDLNYRDRWGYSCVFLRTYTRWQTPPMGRKIPLAQVKRVGFLAYDPITPEAIDGNAEDPVLRTLSSLPDDSGLHFSGRLRPRSGYVEDRDQILDWLQELDLTHLRCLIISFRFSKEIYLVFSDAFLISLNDLKKARFRQESMIFLDAWDNTWHLMRERFLFLQSLISHAGGASVVTSFVPVPQTLAKSFSSMFYERLAENGGRSVYGSLQETRRVLVEQEGNPLAFLFWLYGNPQVEVAELSQQGNITRCDRGKLSSIINEHCTEQEARRFHLALRKGYESVIPLRYDDLRGPSVWDHLENLLEIWETIGDLCQACQVYLTQIRPQDQNLRMALKGECGCEMRISNRA